MAVFDHWKFSAARPQILLAAVFSLAVVGFLLAVILLHPLRIAPEAALHLECAMMILKGRQPYVGVIDSGAAALMYVCLPPALVHLVVRSIHPAIIYNLYILVLVLASTFLTGLILWRRNRHRHGWLFFPIVVSIPVSALVINVELGQREHLFALLIIPYVILRWLRNGGFKIEQFESRICGILAGIAVCLDPLFLLPFLALEIFLRFDKPASRTFFVAELKIALLTLGVYLCHFLFLPFSAFQYFTCIVPLNIVDYVTWDDRMDFLNALGQMDWYRWTSPDRRDILYWSAALCTISLSLRRRVSLLSSLVVLSLMGGLTYVIQGKALSYQALLMVIFCTMQSGIILGLVLQFLIKRLRIAMPGSQKVPNLKSTVLVQAVVILCVVSSIAVFKTSWRLSGKTINLSEFGYIGVADKADLSHFAVKIMERTKPGDAVVILNDNVKAAYPLLLQINRLPGSSVMWGFPFRLFSVAAQDDSWLYTVFLRSWEAPFYEQLGQELQRTNAKCILIQSGRTLDYLLNRDIIEKVKEHYKLDGDVTWRDNADRDADTSNLELWGSWEAMQLYVRKPQ